MSPVLEQVNQTAIQPYMKEELKGQEVVLSTTNGTRALTMASDAPIVVVGSLINLDALCQWLEKQNKHTRCLCSGWQDKFNLEDTICAGAISDYLLGTGRFQSNEDSSIAAKYLYLSAWVNPLATKSAYKLILNSKQIPKTNFFIYSPLSSREYIITFYYIKLYMYSFKNIIFI